MITLFVIVNILQYCKMLLLLSGYIIKFFYVKIIILSPKVITLNLWVMPNLISLPQLCSWLRYCSTRRKVAGSIPDGVTGIFY